MRPLLALTLASLALLPFAAAEDCEPTTSTSDAEQTVVEVPGCALGVDTVICYVVVQHSEECGYGLWVFPESNGRPGLQRHDECRDDTCGGEIESDILVIF